MRERRALLTSVRRAILRVAFLADLVLAIRVPSSAACEPRRSVATARKSNGGGPTPAACRALIDRPAGGVNARAAPFRRPCGLALGHNRPSPRRYRGPKNQPAAA